MLSSPTLQLGQWPTDELQVDQGEKDIRLASARSIADQGLSLPSNPLKTSTETWGPETAHAAPATAPEPPLTGKKNAHLLEPPPTAAAPPEAWQIAQHEAFKDEDCPVLPHSKQCDLRHVLRKGDPEAKKAAKAKRKPRKPKNQEAAETASEPCVEVQKENNGDVCDGATSPKPTPKAKCKAKAKAKAGAKAQANKEKNTNRRVRKRLCPEQVVEETGATPNVQMPLLAIEDGPMHSPEEVTDILFKPALARGDSLPKLGRGNKPKTTRSQDPENGRGKKTQKKRSQESKDAEVPPGKSHKPGKPQLVKDGEKEVLKKPLG